MKVRTSRYGMSYSRKNAKLIARALAVSEDDWNLLPVKEIPARTPLRAHRKRVSSGTIKKVVSGRVKLREGYVTKLWRDGEKFYIVDGHVRAAIYYALNRPMPVRIMDKEG